MLTTERRLRDLEMQFQAVRRELQGVASRPAGPLNLRQGWWLGELAGDLNEGGTATVTILMWDGEDWISAGATVTARAFFPGDLLQGTRVYVRWYRNTFVAIATSDSEGSERIIVRFTLNEDMDSFLDPTASADVLEAVGDGAPDVGETIEVRDLSLNFADCPAGAVGFAVNFGTSSSPDYYIIHCSRVTWEFQAQLASTLLASETGDVTAKLNTSTLLWLDVGDCVEHPPVSRIVVTNPMGFSGSNAGASQGDLVWCVRMQTEQDANGKWQYAIRAVQGRGTKEIVEWHTPDLKQTDTQLVFKSGDPGYVAFTQRIGSESVGLTHDPDEAAPNTNGNFTVTRDGLYQVAFWIEAQPSTSGTDSTFVQGANIDIRMKRGAGLFTVLESCRTHVISYHNHPVSGNLLGYKNGYTCLVNLEVDDLLHIQCLNFKQGTGTDGWQVNRCKVSFEWISEPVAPVAS